MWTGAGLLCREEGGVSLQELLPPGTAVMVDLRQLAASPRAQLRLQATIVMREVEGEEEDNMPGQYTDMFSSYEDRCAFVEELDELYDIFKTIKYIDVDFKHGLEYKERMSRLAEQESEESVEDDWDDDDGEEDDEMTMKEGQNEPEVQTLLPLPDHVDTVDLDVLLYEEARLKPQDQKNLIQSYIDMVTQTSLASSTDKFDLVKLKKTTKIDKPLQFFQDFCVALHRKCLNVKKGFKVGPIFVTQVQVNLILKHGIMAMAKQGNDGKSQKHLQCQSRIRTV